MIYCWGSNPEGHFGGGIEGDSSVPIETENIAFKTISAGSRFAFGITEEGDVYASGANESGQLGLGFKASRINEFTKLSSLKAKQITCGWAHAVILTADSKIFVSGDNSKGQLGLGPDKSYSSATSFVLIEIRIEEPIKLIACGIWSTFVVLQSGKVLFWGQFKNLRSEICWFPVEIEEMKHVSKIAIGHKHIITLNYEGTISGFGCNKYGQIAFNIERGIDILAGWNHSIIQLDDNTILLIGKNGHNQLAHQDPKIERNILKFEHECIVSISVGSDHCLLLSSRRLLVWGWNEHGILGKNHTNQKYGPPDELEFKISKIEGIFCGPVSCFIISK